MNYDQKMEFSTLFIKVLRKEVNALMPEVWNQPSDPVEMLEEITGRLAAEGQKVIDSALYQAVKQWRQRK